MNTMCRKQMKIHFVSLGCPKNRVDSEMMLGRLLQDGHTITSEASEADCVVVNTCSFVRKATDESIDTILEMAQWKQEASGRRLIVTGCLPQRYGKDLANELPEVDKFLGTEALDLIADAVDPIVGPRTDISHDVPAHQTSNMAVIPEAPFRLRTTAPHTAYLKIAEGCSGRCTFCIIPKLRGPHRSRPMDEILREAKSLTEGGVKELIVIAQNTMAYGSDFTPPGRLANLLYELATETSGSWIRLLYGHPDHVTDDILDVIAANNSLCPYFDIPIQHISPRVLRRMGRGHDSQRIIEIFHRIRQKVPNAALRTSVIVGFPGETEDDFNMLLDTVEQIGFDHLGAFAYSDAPDIASNGLDDHIPEKVKKSRLNRLMALQARLSRNNNKKYIGQTIKVLVEAADKPSSDCVVGRACFQAPEIDGVVYVKGGNVRPGEFVNVRITEARQDYDLSGVPA